MRALIDDDWCAPTARAASRPSTRSSAAPPRTPTSTSRPARASTHSTWPAPRSSSRRWIASPTLTGRQYHLFDYAGAPDAERVIVVMGSGAETAEETAQFPGGAAARRSAWSRCTCSGHSRSRISCARCRQLSGRSPCSIAPRSPAAPASRCTWMWSRPCRSDDGVNVQNVQTFERSPAHVIGGRYGLSSKEFTPAMVKAVFDELQKAEPKNHFTIGINDDVTHTSLAYDPSFSIEGRRNGALRVLGTRRRRHGRRQQELDQDHRRGDRQLCPGLLRLRLEEVGLGDDLAPALRATARSARPT